MANDRITEFILRLRNEADAADFSALAREAIPQPARPGFVGRLRTRAAAAVAATVMSVGGLGGVAYAANGATPGDFLYGLDRALEAVGIGNGGASERIAEAISLVEHGATGRGLEHAAGVVPDDTGGLEVREAAGTLGPDEAAGVQAEVMALLTYLSDNVGNIDGTTVAGYARAIRDHPSGPPDGVPAGPPDETPVGPPEDTPGGPPVSTPVGPPTTTSTTTTTTTLPLP